MTENPDLSARVRAALVGRDVREVRMFGGLSFMVDDRMLVATRGEELLVRVDPDHHDDLTSRPGAQTAHMGKERTMGRGWITVDAQHLATEDDLEFWLQEGHRHHAGGQA